MSSVTHPHILFVCMLISDHKKVVVSFWKTWIKPRALGHKNRIYCIMQNVKVFAKLLNKSK